MNNNRGELIRKARTARGMSQENLAELMNVDRSLISKWETGKALIPDHMFERLSEILDVTDDTETVEEIIEEKTVSSSKPERLIPNVKNEDVIAVLLLCMSLILGPLGILLALLTFAFSLKWKLSKPVIVLSFLITLLIGYDILVLYHYGFFPLHIMVR